MRRILLGGLKRATFVTAVLLPALLFPAGLSAEPIVTLNDIRSCQRIVSISVRYSWVEDEAARLFSKHHFVFLEGRYEGYAYAAIRSKEVNKTEKIENLLVPTGVMQAIAIILKESPLEKVDNPPAVEVIEGQPYYEISVELCTDGVKFFTYSWDEDYKWALTIGDETYLVSNDSPLSAIRVLEPFMHFKIVQQLKDEAFGTKVVKPEEVKEPVKLVKPPKTFKNIYFDTADYKIKPQYDRVLFGILDYMLRKPETKLLVSGHCDERGEDAYNMALGEKRASSVVSRLINRGVDPRRVKAHSLGESRPVAYGHSEEAWKQNRRVEFHFGEKLELE